MNSADTLIVGIGSPHGDDQAGWHVAARLAETLEGGGLAVRQATSPIQLVDWLDDIDRLVLCDACQGLGPVGTLRRWTWPAAELANASWSGTHNLPLPAVLQLADRLGRLPPSVIIWTVEGRTSDALAAVSPEIAAAVATMADEITREVSQEANPQTSPRASVQE